MTDPTGAGGTRTILSTSDDVRGAVIALTRQAERALTILTPDLEPEIYNHEAFLETLKTFVLARSYARIRVLITDPVHTMKSGNEFVNMGRRLHSYIEFRNAKEEDRGREDAFCIADDNAIVYRTDGRQWDGMADSNEPVVARKYLEEFEELWNACAIEPTLRLMQL